MSAEALLFLPALLAAIALCAIYRWRAAAAGWLAYPDARSSHRNATVSGAGVAIVAALALTLLLLGPALPQAGHVLLVFAVLLSLLGLIDDLVNLGVRLRLGLYAVAAALTAAWICAPGGAWPGLVITGLVALWILGFSNLFNFMDGIDGLAALQALSAALVLGGIGSWLDVGHWYIAICFSLAGAFAGFLVFNRPRARLFMGDAGSIPAGYLLAALLVSGWWLEAVPLYAGLILLAVFLADAVTTLVFRAARRQSLVRAHREHLYQRLAQRWDSHARVDALFLAVQWLWLTPLAIVAALHPAYGAALCVLACFPLLITMVKLRSIQ
ncbi:MAG: glycosyl transferase family 4 [Chromatocurvus sp.]